MTNRNELERLLAAATEGPWAVCTDATGDTFVASMTDSAETVCEMGAMDTDEGQAQLEADAALICFLRNNAQHYLSLMGDVERLRDALGRISSCDLLEVERYYERTWCIPETGDKYTRREPVFKRSSYQNAEEFQAIARQALGETHDN